MKTTTLLILFTLIVAMTTAKPLEKQDVEESGQDIEKLIGNKDSVQPVTLIDLADIGDGDTITAKRKVRHFFGGPVWQTYYPWGPQWNYYHWHNNWWWNSGYYG